MIKPTIGVVLLAVVIVTASAVATAERTDQEHARSSRQATTTRIAFTRMREDVGRAGSDFRLEAEIWMMNGNGAEPIRLTRNTTDDLGAVWSPDSKTIAFYGVQFTADGKGQLVAGPPYLFLIDVEARAQRPLLNDKGEAVRGRFPSWSPDGRRIVFDTGGPASSISIINLDGTNLKQLPNHGTRSIRPDWSPDGRQIAFARGVNGSEQIYVMSADGSDVVRLTEPTNGTRANAPDWSPDGGRIVFQSNRDSTDTTRNDQIYVMNADGNGQRRLTSHAGPDGDPAWSQDGRMIAFERGTQPGSVDQVFVMTLDGGQPTPLTQLPSANGHPAWDRGPQSR